MSLLHWRRDDNDDDNDDDYADDDKWMYLLYNQGLLYLSGPSVQLLNNG